MKIVMWRVVSVWVLICLIAARPAKFPGHKVFVSSFENVMGTSFDLKVWAQGEPQADDAERVALAEIDRLSAILSSYDPNSEFRQWAQTRDQDVSVSPELYQVLRSFDQWRMKTNGALDPAAGLMVSIWKQAELAQQLPSADVLHKAVEEVAKPHWILNDDLKTARHLSGTPLVLNSFVKSYIMESALEKVMHIPGISTALINIGGDIIIRGKEKEQVSVAAPGADNIAALAGLRVGNKAIATSGNYKRGFRINGTWYSHIIDPRTGMPAGEIVSATVVADDAQVAGALATAFNVLDLESARQLASETAGVEYLILTAKGERIQSKGWASMTETSLGQANTALVQKPWNNGYELAVNLELMKFEGRTRRPFVAVWVEDKDKKTVKTLALWFNKPRWLPDLKEWFRKNSDTYQNGSKDVFSIGSATRPAGTYTIKWDGKNDDGVLVPEGTYTVCVEVAREHGTYQIMKQEVVCKNKPQQFNWKPNEEVSSASVEYRKQTN